MEASNQAWTTAPEDLDKLTAKEIDELSASIFNLQDDIKEKEEMVSELKGHLEKMKSKMLAFLQHYKRKNFSSPYGTAYIKEVISANVPKDPEDKTKLFAWLKEREIFDHYATVNHNSLQSLVKEEFAAALERKEDCKIPGIGEIKIHNVLNLKRSK